MWQTRATTETAMSVRTWFGTLTLAPHHHVRLLNQCRARAYRDGDDFDALSEGSRFAAYDRQIYSEITKYLKRVRKMSGAKLRFLITTEQHKSGLAHYHVLCHEVDPATPVRKKTLDEQWTLGFAKWRLCNSLREASYVTKYISKDVRARVRASARYGNLTEQSELAVRRDTPTPSAKAREGLPTDRPQGVSVDPFRAEAQEG